MNICGLSEERFREQLTFCYLAGMPQELPKRLVEWVVHQDDKRMLAAVILLAVDNREVHPRGASSFYIKLNAELLRFADDKELREPRISPKQWAAVETGLDELVASIRQEAVKLIANGGGEEASDDRK